MGDTGFEPVTLPIASGCSEPAELFLADNFIYFVSAFPILDLAFMSISFAF